MKRSKKEGKKMTIENKVLEYIQKYHLIEAEDKLVIGVSGGPDSMALLHLLVTLKKEKKIDYQMLIVAHVNHMLRKEAEQETQYVEQFCRLYEIPCLVKKVKVEELAQKEKKGTEEMGRIVRYQFFEEVRQKEKAQKIVTAHQANDNAETVLMNLLRGTGIAGLKGIEPIRTNEEGIVFIRPLLNCTKKELEEYCEEKNLQPKIDISNQENVYNRNKIRNILIPFLEKEWNPNIIVTLNRLSDLARQENHYLEKQTKQAYEEMLIEEKIKLPQEKSSILLSLKKWKEQDFVIKSRLVRYTINRLLGTAKDIEKIHVEDIIKLCEKNIGNKYLIPNKKVKVLVNKGKIFFLEQ